MISVSPPADVARERFWQSSLADLVQANLEAFGRLVKRHRQALGLSQERAAEWCDVARMTIHQIETGGWEPSSRPRRLAAIRKIMDGLVIYPSDIRAEVAAMNDEESTNVAA